MIAKEVREARKTDFRGRMEQHFKEVFAVQETKQEHTNYKIKLEKDA